MYQSKMVFKNHKASVWRCDRPGQYAKNCVKSRDHKCEKCGKIGHYEICCKSKQGQGQTQERNTHHGRGAQSKQGRAKQEEREGVVTT